MSKRLSAGNRIDVEVAGGKTGHRKGDSQVIVAKLLDVVGRIAVGGGLGHPVDHSLEVIEAKQQGAIEDG